MQCISLIDYDPDKMSDSEQPHLELKIAEGNLLRCYKQPVEDTGYTMAEVKRGKLDIAIKKFSPSLCLSLYSWESPTREVLFLLNSLLKCMDHLPLTHRYILDTKRGLFTLTIALVGQWVHLKYCHVVSFRNMNGNLHPKMNCLQLQR